MTADSIRPVIKTRNLIPPDSQGHRKLSALQLLEHTNVSCLPKASVTVALLKCLTQYKSAKSANADAKSFEVTQHIVSSVWYICCSCCKHLALWSIYWFLVCVGRRTIVTFKGCTHKWTQGRQGKQEKKEINNPSGGISVHKLACLIILEPPPTRTHAHTSPPSLICRGCQVTY